MVCFGILNAGCDGNLRRQVEYVIAVLHDAPKSRPIANVRNLDQGPITGNSHQPRQVVNDITTRKIIEHVNGVAGREQPVSEIRPDESRSARYKNATHTVSPRSESSADACSTRGFLVHEAGGEYCEDG